MKGFTLLEILVTVLIFTFIIAGIYGVLIITQTNYDTNSVSLNLQRQVRQGMSLLIREIRQAYWKSIWDPAAIPLPVNNITGPDANNNYAITFNTLNANGINYSVIKTVVSGNELWQLKRTIGTEIRIIANDIRSLTFTRDPGGAQVVTIKVGASRTFRSLGKDRTLTFSLTEQVQLRNP